MAYSSEYREQIVAYEKLKNGCPRLPSRFWTGDEKARTPQP